MFLLKKLITCIVLPPGVFILVFIVSGIYLIRRCQKIGYLLVFSGLCLFALSISPVKNVLIVPLEGTFPLETSPIGDVVVVLGSGPQNEALSRLVGAYILWKQLHIPLILTGSGEKGTEKELLIELGIPENEIIEERCSKDTSENARYTKQIIEKRGFKAPILVTSAYHMKRAVFLFEKQGIKVEPFPCGLKSEEEEEEYGILDFLPKASVLEESSKAMKEYMGLMVARIEKWLGLENREMGKWVNSYEKI